VGFGCQGELILLRPPTKIVKKSAEKVKGRKNLTKVFVNFLLYALDFFRRFFLKERMGGRKGKMQLNETVGEYRSKREAGAEAAGGRDRRSGAAVVRTRQRERPHDRRSKTLKAYLKICGSAKKID
jgi:hypothetical protein